MNIYYFDPSLDCSLFFISLFLYPITLYPSLAFSVFTRYPLTHLLIPSRPFLLPHTCRFHLPIVPSVSFVSPFFNIFPPTLLSLPLCTTSTVKASYSSSKLQLGCLYSELSQVQSAKWTYQNKSHQLHSETSGLGSISTSLPLPITSDTAGNYTCTLQLKNGQTVQATQAVTLPHEGGRGWHGITNTGLFSDFLHQQYIMSTGVPADFLSTQWR